MTEAGLWLLAWRNLWRNKRRTGLTVLSVAAGLAGLLFGQSLVESVQVQLVDKSTGVHTGHLQVLDPEVPDPKFPDRWLEDADAVERKVRALPNVAAFQRRVAVTGLASSKKDSAGILICGVEPEKDPKVLTMASYLSSGRNLRPGDDGVYLGTKLATQLGVGLGDELVLMATSDDGSLGAELATVTGLFHTGSHTFDASIVYVDIAKAQSLMGAEDRASSFVLRLEDPSRLAETKALLAESLAGLDARAAAWEEIDYELVGIREYQDALLRIVLAVVFFIVALGILNTLLMSMYERVREFGLLMALGCRPRFVGCLVVAESALIGLVGAALGLGGGAALIVYYGRVGLDLPLQDSVNFFMPFDSEIFLRFDWSRHLAALAAVFATCVLSGLPPALRAMRLKPAEALRQI